MSYQMHKPLPCSFTKAKVAILAMLASLLLSACAPYNDNKGLAESILSESAARLTPTDIRSLTYATVDGMLKENASLGVTGGPIVVGSIADIQDINITTPLGNSIAELVRSRLVQRQLTVTDLRLRSQVLLDRGQGELMLSRDRRAVLPPPVAAEVVSGTYAVGYGTVYISLKIITTSDARILAAGDFTLPRTADVNKLLSGIVTSMR